MPRPVAPWTWRRALRDHGPRSQGLLLTLYTIGTYMDRDGIAWPSQELIAAGARASVRTVQRHIAIAERAGWLGIQLAGRGGQGWRHNAYRAAVPDDVPLDDLEEGIADAITAQNGGIEPIERHDTIVSSPSVKGHDTIVSARTSPGLERDDNRHQNVTTKTAEGDDKNGRTSRHNSVVLTLYNSQRTHAKTEAQSKDCGASFSEKGKRQEPGRRSPPFPKTQPTQEGLQGRALKQALRKPSDGWVLSDAELGERIGKLWSAGIRDPEQIVKTLSQYASHERIRRVLSHRFNVPWVSV